MSTRLMLYPIALTLFLIIDLAWLGYVAKDLYRNALGPLLAPKFNMVAAGVFYALFVVGLMIFGVEKGISANDWRVAALWGGLFGFFCYATYDLTNLATLNGYPLKIAIIDMVWGTFLGAAVSGLTIIVGRLILGDLSR